MLRSLTFLDVDPWLDLCYHSTEAPLRTSMDNNPEYLIAGAGHHWDSFGILNLDAEPLFIQQAHVWETKAVKKGLRGFKDWKPSPSNITAVGYFRVLKELENNKIRGDNVRLVKGLSPKQLAV